MRITVFHQPPTSWRPTSSYCHGDTVTPFSWMMIVSLNIDEMTKGDFSNGKYGCVTSDCFQKLPYVCLCICQDKKGGSCNGWSYPSWGTHEWMEGWKEKSPCRLWKVRERWKLTFSLSPPFSVYSMSPFHCLRGCHYLLFGTWRRQKDKCYGTGYRMYCLLKWQSNPVCTHHLLYKWNEPQLNKFHTEAWTFFFYPTKFTFLLLLVCKYPH